MTRPQLITSEEFEAFVQRLANPVIIRDGVHKTLVIGSVTYMAPLETRSLAEVRRAQTEAFASYEVTA